MADQSPGGSSLASHSSTAERILRAALLRIAVDGLSATLRKIAEDAGVSAGLIIHHFGSREKLLQACDARVLEIAREQKTELIVGDAGTMLTQLAQTEEYAPAVGYVLRRLQAGGPLARQLVEDFAADAAEYLQQGVETGTISPSTDPGARSRVLTEMALGGLLLQLPAQGDRLDLGDLPRWLRDYTERILPPLLEMYTVPLLTDSTWLEAYRGAQHATSATTAEPAPASGTAPAASDGAPATTADADPAADSDPAPTAAADAET
jgi:AcrR family transcriptional regulator